MGIPDGQKKILIVCRSFYPVNSPRSFRATELAKELARQGNLVTVLTPRHSEHHDGFEQEFKLQIKDLGPVRMKPWALKGKGLERLFRRAMIRFPRLFFEYPDIQFMWLVKNALKKETGYDLLVSIAVPYPIHWGVAWARTAIHRLAPVWVADCGDPYMLTQTDSFKKPFYFKYLERWFSRRADFISIPRIEMKANYYPEFHGKIVEIPQGFNFSDVKIEKSAPDNPVPTFAFAGAFLQKVRNPAQILGYLADCTSAFKFIIYTRDQSLIKSYKSRLKEKMEVRSYIPRHELLFELSKMDFLINIGYDPVHQMPSKLIDYYLTGRPVYSFNVGDFRPSIFEAFLNGDYRHQLRPPNMEKYNIEKVAAQFLALSQKIT